MCFSATASFSAAAVLGTAGIISLKQTNHPSQRMFASIPLLFGAQQATEGILWLALDHDYYSTWQTSLTYAFLFFAQMLWTTWVPLSFLFMETDLRRKLVLQFLSIAGMLASCFLGYRMFTEPVYAKIDCYHVNYIFQSPKNVVVVNSVLYVLAILVPPFVSSAPKSTLLGIMITSSLLLTKLFYEAWLISVWCFFAAILSITVVYIIREIQKVPGRHLYFKKETHSLP